LRPRFAGGIDTAPDDPRMNPVQITVAVIMAVPTLALSGQLFQVWRDPLRHDRGAWVRHGLGLFVSEFIVLNSAVAIAVYFEGRGARGSELMPMLVVLGCYLLFAGAIAMAFRSPMLLASFLTLTAVRGFSAIFLMSQEDIKWMLAHSVSASILYFGAVILSLFPLPERGIGEEMRQRVRREMPNSSGHWVEKPHCAIAAAAIYYLLLGLAEIFLLSWMDPGWV
jgi:hypothetical protein